VNACGAALGEDEQIQLVMDYHQAAAEVLPSPRAHAVLHVVIENQIVLGQVIPVAAILVRLQNEGLDRHEAIRAIASVLVGHMNEVLAAGKFEEDPNPAYYRQLGALTASEWRRQFK
jgi:hypothetical protein